MKQFYAILLCLFSFQMVKGQCPAGYINLTTQTQVDNFILNYPSCTALPGSLRVAGNISNLNGLQNIVSIGSDLRIEESTLTNLVGLENLKTVNGDFDIRDNGALTTLNGLQGLVSVGGDFNIIRTNVSSLNALESLTSVDGLGLAFTNLPNLQGLQNLKSAPQGLNITYNPSLASLSGIDILDGPDPYVYLAENPLLTDCAVPYICKASAPTPGRIGSTIRDNAPGCNSRAEVVEICVEEGTLPVTLKGFQVKKIESDIQIVWSTTSETDSKNFEIQRSNNGKSWVKIGTVMANGKSEREIVYSFTDKSPLPGQNFYRLKMVDLDNTFAYSRIVNININSKALAEPFPNPVSDKINLGADLKKVRSIEISNAVGKKIYTSDRAQQEIDVKQFPGGLYFLKVNDEHGNVQSFKFVKQ